MTIHDDRRDAGLGRCHRIVIHDLADATTAVKQDDHRERPFARRVACAKVRLNHRSAAIKGIPAHMLTGQPPPEPAHHDQAEKPEHGDQDESDDQGSLHSGSPNRGGSNTIRP